MKGFADDNFKFDETGRKFSKRVENAVEKQRNCMLRVNFSFSHSVFNRFVLQMYKNKGFFGKRLENRGLKTMCLIPLLSPFPTMFSTILKTNLLLLFFSLFFLFFFIFFFVFFFFFFFFFFSPIQSNFLSFIRKREGFISIYIPGTSNRIVLDIRRNLTNLECVPCDDNHYQPLPADSLNDDLKGSTICLYIRRLFVIFNIFSALSRLSVYLSMRSSRFFFFFFSFAPKPKFSLPYM